MDNFYSTVLMSPQALELTFQVKNGALFVDGLHQLGLAAKEGQKIRVKIEASLNNCTYVNIGLRDPSTP